MRFNRRNMLKKVGAVGIVGSGFSTSVTASEDSESTSFEFETEDLAGSTAKEQFEQALSTEPGQAITEFLQQKKQASIVTDDLTGHRVSPTGQLPDHTVLRTPITSNESSSGALWFYRFGEKVIASAAINGSGYRSNQTIINEFNQDVITAEEWQEQKPSQHSRVNAQLSPGVDTCESVPLRNVCEYLRDIKEIVPATVYISINGNRYTVGDVAVGATGCALLDILEEDSPERCSINTVDICVEWGINSIGLGGIDYEASVEIVPCN